EVTMCPPEWRITTPCLSAGLIHVDRALHLPRQGSDGLVITIRMIVPSFVSNKSRERLSDRVGVIDDFVFDEKVNAPYEGNAIKVIWSDDAKRTLCPCFWCLLRDGGEERLPVVLCRGQYSCVDTRYARSDRTG